MSNANNLPQNDLEKQSLDWQQVRKTAVTIRLAVLDQGLPIAAFGEVWNLCADLIILAEDHGAVPLPVIARRPQPPAATSDAAKPARAKLSKRQIEFLSLAVRNGGEVHHRNAMYIASGRGNAAVMKGLVSLGLMDDEWSGWTITDKGRDALEAVSR